MLLENHISVDIIAKFFDIATIIILLYITLKNITKVMSETKLLVYMVFFVFYILPLFLDYFVGYPEYTNELDQGFIPSQLDTATRIVYDICLLVATWIILRYKPPKKQPNIIISNKVSSTINYMVIVGMFLPLLSALLIQLPSYMLVVPMWREVLKFVDPPKNYSLVEQIDFVGICCCIICLFGKLKNTIFLTRVVAIILLYINICIEGKRGIIFFSLLCVVLMFLIQIQTANKEKQNNKHYFKKFALFGLLTAAIVIAMVIISVNVKAGRGYEDDPLVMYTTLRVDFLRDDRVRFSIYECLYPDKLKILDYPGQTIWPLFDYAFPIDVILSKLFDFRRPTYSHYLSSALMGGGLSVDESFMTPALFGELLSNFSFLGVFVMALFSIWFIKIINKYPYPINVFLMISFTAWQMYSVGYIMLYLEFTFALCVIYNFKIKNSRNKCRNMM